MDGARTEPFMRLVRRYRREAELTQEGLAERAGLSVRAIRDIEAGSKHRPRPDTVQLLLEALAIPEEERADFRAAAAQLAEQDIPVFTVPGRPHTNLPLQPTPFIGRQRELDEVGGLLRWEEVRLLTLTGPGGVGKTRLALQVTESMRDLFPCGSGRVWTSGHVAQ